MKTAPAAARTAAPSGVTPQNTAPITALMLPPSKVSVLTTAAISMDVSCHELFGAVGSDQANECEKQMQPSAGREQRLRQGQQADADSGHSPCLVLGSDVARLGNVGQLRRQFQRRQRGVGGNRGEAGPAAWALHRLTDDRVRNAGLPLARRARHNDRHRVEPRRAAVVTGTLYPNRGRLAKIFRLNHPPKKVIILVAT